MIWRLLFIMAGLVVVWAALESALALGVVVELALSLGGLGAMAWSHIRGRP